MKCTGRTAGAQVSSGQIPERGAGAAESERSGRERAVGTASGDTGSVG